VGYVLDKVEYELDLGEHAGTLRVQFDLMVLGDQWQEVFLIDGDARLEQVEAGGQTVLWRDGCRLLTKQPGKAKVALQFATRGWRELMEDGLRLKSGDAVLKRLTVRGLPDGYQVRVSGATTGVVENGVSNLQLGGAAGDLLVKLERPHAEEPPLPSTWVIESQWLVGQVDGRLQYRGKVFARADDGSGMAMTLVLPPNATALKIDGEDLAEWTAGRGEDGRKLATVHWKTRDVLDRELRVSYVVPQSPLAERWVLLAPATPDRAEAKAWFAVVPDEGMELEGPAVRDLPAQRLASWLREALGDARFVTVEGTGVLELKTRWLPVVATAEAAVSEVKAQQRVVEDGSMRTTITYAVRHQALLQWRLELPTGVEVLSCTVAGKPVKPIQRDDGAVEIRLPADGEETKEGTPVTITYVGKATALDPVSGKIGLELPRTDLFIERLDWQVAIPGRFEVTAAEGTVSLAGAEQATPDATTIGLRKDLCRGERPGVELFYQQKDLGR
jgi:hypothetical protein